MKELKISKELFVESLNNIKEELDRRTLFNNTMQSFSDSYYVSNIGDKWLNTAIKLLEDCVYEECDPLYGTTIEWWLFEDSDKEIAILPEHEDNDTGKAIIVNVKEPEDLYDYFQKYN